MLTDAQIRGQAIIALLDIGASPASELPEGMVADVAKRMKELLRWERERIVAELRKEADWQAELADKARAALDFNERDLREIQELALRNFADRLEAQP